jgi:tripartite-type tricarboxylate transporter receptor subunit TctC
MFRIICASLSAVGFALLASAAAAAYPDKPIRIIIPFAPGGGTDILTRALQGKFEKALGTPVIIDNRGGAGGILGFTLVAKAPPDGYTLLATSASFTYTPSLHKDLQFDAVKDFKPITNFAQQPLVLAVHPSMPVSNVKDLLALARKRPGEINYGSAGRGSNLHMTTELFKYMAKIDLKEVPYKGGGPAGVGLMSGEIQVGFVSILSSVSYMKAGRIRGIAVSTKERTPVLPDVPSLHEAGVPGYDKPSWTGFLAPGGVPDAIIDQIYAGVGKVLKNPDTVKALAMQGSVAVGNTPAEFGAFVRSELQEWARLIKEMKL